MLLSSTVNDNINDGLPDVQKFSTPGFETPACLEFCCCYCFEDLPTLFMNLCRVL